MMRLKISIRPEPANKKVLWQNLLEVLTRCFHAYLKQDMYCYANLVTSSI